MEEYRDLDLTIAVFTRAARAAATAAPRGGHRAAGLPARCRSRRCRRSPRGRTRAGPPGGAGIKVRIVKGANLAMEHVDATVHDWPLATWSTKQETDTNYKRVLAARVHPREHRRRAHRRRRPQPLRPRLRLAARRSSAGSTDRVEFEMLLGMADRRRPTPCARRPAGCCSTRRSCTREEFDAAISYLVRRLEENASHRQLHVGRVRAGRRRRSSARARPVRGIPRRARRSSCPTPHRTQDRLHPDAADDAARDFENEPDTDPALAANREWGARHPRAQRRLATWARSRSRARGRRLGGAVCSGIIAAPRAAGARLGQRPGQRARRAARPRRRSAVGVPRPAHRGHGVRDRQDHRRGRRRGQRGHRLRPLLRRRARASSTPSTARRSCPSASPPSSRRGTSRSRSPAAGCSRRSPPAAPCSFKPAPPGAAQRRRPRRGALGGRGPARPAHASSTSPRRDLGQQLVTAPEVDRVILTGSFETAALFRSWKSDLPLLAETSGKNAIIVTPSADLDLAVADVVKSAFGNAGQKCSAASLVILVGSVGDVRAVPPPARRRRHAAWRSAARRTRRPRWARSSSRCRASWRAALTQLAEGESWLVKPRQLDDTDRLWSPGVRDGVLPGSEFHLTEYFGPVLGIMTARTLDEAIALQNAVDYGLTAGIHSLDPDEVARWLDTVQAGNLYVNRGITGAIVRRQPFGGWKRSGVGTGRQGRRPEHAVRARRRGSPSRPSPTRRPRARRARPAGGARSSRRASPRSTTPTSTACAAARSATRRPGTTEFGVVARRLGPRASSATCSATVRPRSRSASPRAATSVDLDPGARGGRARAGDACTSARRFRCPPACSLWRPLRTRSRMRCCRSRRSSSRPTMPGTRARPIDRPAKVRLIGGDAVAPSRTRSAERPTSRSGAGPVTSAGRVELLPFLREQAVSITAHRFGNPDRGVDRAARSDAAPTESTQRPQNAAISQSRTGARGRWHGSARGRRRCRRGRGWRRPRATGRGPRRRPHPVAVRVRRHPVERATNEPARPRVSITPAVSSSRYARATVFAASPSSSASARTVGSFVPAGSEPSSAPATTCARSCSNGGSAAPRSITNGEDVRPRARRLERT